MPRDFRKKTFSKVLRGYSPEEVEAYLAFVNNEYQKLDKKNNENARNLAAALKKNEAVEFELNNNPIEMKSAEELAEPVRKAEREAAAIVAEAEKKAAAIIAEASRQAAIEAEKITEEACRYSDEMRERSEGMAKTADAIYNEILSFRDTMFELYNNHIEQVESIVDSADSFSSRVESLRDSSLNGSSVNTDDETDEEDVDTEDEESFDDSSEDGEEAEFSEIEEDNEPYVEEEITDDSGTRDIYIDPFADEDEEFEDAEEVKEISDDESGDYELTEDDIARQKQLDKFFGILNDSELLSAEDEDSDFEDEPTRVLDMGGKTESLRKSKSANNDFGDIDSILDGNDVRDMSLTDEFDIVYAGSTSKKNVDEIRRQPTVAPTAPPKKNVKHFAK